jgi:hypothetical protein
MSPFNNLGMRTTIRMNDALQRRMAEIAEKEGRTFTDLVEEAAVLLIKDREREPSSPTPVTLPVFDGELIIPPGMTLEQWIVELQARDDEEYLRRTMHGDA